MKKEFKINVPDSLYSDSFAANNVATFVYEGPDVLHVNVHFTGTVDIVDEERPYVEDNGQHIRVVVDANSQPEIAYMLVVPRDPTSMIFEEEIQPDGQVYNNLTNPGMHDYFNLKYSFEESKFNLENIVLSSETTGYVEAKRILRVLEILLENNEKELVELSAEQVATIDSYVTELTAFADEQSLLTSWKCTTFDEIPPIPDTIKSLI